MILSNEDPAGLFDGLTFGIAPAVSPMLGGLIMVPFDPRWLWYVSGAISAVSVLGFVALHRREHSGRLTITEASDPGADDGAAAGDV